MRETVIQRIKQQKLIVVLRNISSGDIKALAQALYDGGIRIVEVTFNQSRGAEGLAETSAALKMLKANFG